MRTIHKSIKVTKDYNMFRKIRGNRDINPTHVKKLVLSMSQNYVPVPAHINEKFGLVDGQHRLEACKELNLPFYYYIIEGSGIDDVSRINRHRKNWGFTEWMNRYADNGNIEYQGYRAFLNQWGFDHWSTIFLLCKTKGCSGRRELREMFQDGLLKLTTIEQGKKRARMILDLEEYYPNFRKRGLVQAMIRVFNDHRYNHKTFLHKLSLNRDLMYDCATVGQYLQRIDTIFNKGSLKKDRVNFSLRWEDADSLFSEVA
tara:strand:- start:596 stop:1369 length:774 start_codon:yes stop_codon:yes gene_type:complete